MIGPSAAASESVISVFSTGAAVCYFAQQGRVLTRRRAAYRCPCFRAVDRRLRRRRGAAGRSRAAHERTAGLGPGGCARLYVGSEVGRLRRVILHRPELSLQRLTPRNMEDLLFDDVLRVSQAAAEHDRFAEVLRSNGV